MYSNFKERAIEYVKEAVAEDNAGNYQRAFELYKIALEYFGTHLKYEKNARARETITAKFKEYLERAEYVKSLLDGQQPAEPSANGATGQKMKPGGGGGDKDNDEKDKLRASLGNAIMVERPDVKWDDVAGLEGAKDSLKEAVILPVKFPQFFTDLSASKAHLTCRQEEAMERHSPVRAARNGEVLLAKAVATEAESTFFNVSSSDLVSKWLGESEKLVNQLFSLAREKAPSIVFIDEIDALCSSRGDGESEASRRIKTEFLVQMQGVNSNESRVLVLGATNLPYALDQAMRRRFDRRIYIPLPELAARAHMFKVHLGDTPHALTQADFEMLGKQTEGFSGSDVNVVVKDVLMEPVRKTQEATHFRQAKGSDGQTVYEPCSPSEKGAVEATLTQLAEKGLASQVQPPRISMRDFEKVLLRARPTVSGKDLKEFEQFTAEFGEEG